MVRNLGSKLNALRKVSFYCSFKTRKAIAQGLVMSNLCHLVQLYGSSSGFLLTLLQTIQNAAARIVTRLPWHTHSDVLLSQCGWLSVKQMVAFHSLMLLFRIRQSGKPQFLNEKMDGVFKYNTRFAVEGNLPLVGSLRTSVGSNSFLYRTIKLWNSLPPEIKMCDSLKSFKIKVHLWTKHHH